MYLLASEIKKREREKETKHASLVAMDDKNMHDERENEIIECKKMEMCVEFLK